MGMDKKQRAVKKWADLESECDVLGVKLVAKDGWFWAILGGILGVLGNKEFNSSYITTIGKRIAFPPKWLDEFRGTPNGCGVLAHELVHVRQFQKFGLGSIWLGVLPMFFLYCLLPLPCGFAWFRWYFEREAYVVGEKVEMELKNHSHLNFRRVNELIDQMVGPGYFYTMAWSQETVRNYFEKHLGKQ